MEVIVVTKMPQRSKLKLPALRLTTDETPGQRLSRLRKERGLTQVQLAEQTGLTQGLVTSYERGRLRMHAEMVARFAMALGVSADELLGIPGKGSRLQEESTTPARLSLKLVRRLRKIETLPDPKQKALLQTIDGFLRGEGISS